MQFTPSRKTITSLTRFLVVGGIVFLIGLIWNFPYERIQASLTARLAQTTGYQISMESISPALPLGFEAKNATIDGPPLGGTPVHLEFVSLRITTSPISLLTFLFKRSGTISYRAEQATNTWKGDVSYGPKNTSFSVSTKGLKIDQAIPLSDLDPLLAGSELKIAATIGLSAELSAETPALQQGDLSKANGMTTVTISDVLLDAPMLGEMPFNKIVLDSALKDGNLDIKSLTLTGPKVSGKASGSLKIQPYLPRSQLQLDAQLSLSEEAKELRTLVMTFGSNAGLRMDERGMIAMKVTGPIAPIDRLRVRGY